MKTPGQLRREYSTVTERVAYLRGYLDAVRANYDILQSDVQDLDVTMKMVSMWLSELTADDSYLSELGPDEA